MSNDSRSIVFVLVEEFLGTRKGDLVDILVNLIGSHAYTIVAHSQRLGVLIDFDCNLEVIGLAIESIVVGQCFQFLYGIDSIGNQLSQENLMIAIEELFNYGENVGCSYPN